MTDVLIVAADGFVLLPLIIFGGKTNLTIKDISNSAGRFCHIYPGKSVDE